MKHRRVASLPAVLLIAGLMVALFAVRAAAELAEDTPPEAVTKVLAQPASREKTKALREAARQWAASDPRAALAWAQKGTVGFEQQQMTNTILAVWTSKEPAAAATYALGFPPEKRASWESLRQVMNLWGRKEPQAAIAWVQKLDPGNERNDLTNRVVDGWALLEPEAAAAFALSQPPGRERTSLLYTAASGWIYKDPAAAWKFAISLPAETFAPVQMQDLFGTWGQRDPATALAHVNELPDPAKRRSTQDWLVARLAEKDPAAALDHARKLAGAERDSALYQVAKMQANRDPKTAAAIAAEIAPGEGQKYVGEMLASGQGEIALSKAATDPAAAIALLDQIPPGRQKNFAIENVALAIARRDPRRGMALVDTIPDAAEADGVRENLLPIWAMSDFEGAVAWMRQLPAGAARDRIASRLGYQWAKQNPREALEFMPSLADSAARSYFQGQLAEQWLAVDPAGVRAAAIGLAPGKIRDEFIGCLLRRPKGLSQREAVELLPSLSGGDVLPEAVERVVMPWAKSDAPAAAAWAVALPPGPLRYVALPKVVVRLAAADRSAVMGLLRKLPEDDARDLAISYFTRQLSQSPDLADEWIAQIRDEKVRQATVYDFAFEWLRRDRGAAEAWLAKQKIPEEHKRRLLGTGK